MASRNCVLLNSGKLVQTFDVMRQLADANGAQLRKYFAIPLVEGSHSTPEALVKSKNAAVQQLQSLVINPAGDAGEGVVSITSIPKMMR